MRWCVCVICVVVLCGVCVVCVGVRAYLANSGCMVCLPKSFVHFRAKI